MRRNYGQYIPNIHTNARALGSGISRLRCPYAVGSWITEKQEKWYPNFEEI